MNLYSFKKIQISIASPEKILELSNGEVTKASTLNYKTLRPKEGGLFCTKIFGPIKDYQCNCGRYNGAKYENHVCEKCGVTVLHSDVRRLRMGHITLASPVVHIWFLKALPSYLSLLLNIPLEEIEDILNSEGPDVLYTLLKSFDLINEYIHLRQQILQVKEHTDKVTQHNHGAVLQITDKYKRLTKRFKLIESFLKNKKRPEWLIIKVLPVIPPDLRPLVKVKNDVFVSSDLNYFYKSIIKRNNRLKLLISEKVPYNLIKSEKRMLQQAVDSLLDNMKSKYQVVNKKKEPLKSLSDRLGGKEGRFRHNLLGKRVDYSGRSVIISGPKLKLSQCGLPLHIVLELFKPLVYIKLKDFIFPSSLNKFENLDLFDYSNRKNYSIIIKELKKIIKSHPVLLNRAPTLHRLNIQAFEPILINDKAIQLHPLVCSSFNADFDGDQMAVHLPLSLESQIESRLLMFSFNNIISNANGKAVITPSQDIIFGLYYATLEIKDTALPILFRDYKEVQSALYEKKINLHTQIRVPIIEYDAWNTSTKKMIHSTVGKILLYNILPKNKWCSFKLIDKQLNKKDVQNLVEHVYNSASKTDFLVFMDKLMSFGFYLTYQVGISLTKDDLIIPLIKEHTINNSVLQTNWFNHKYSKNFSGDEDVNRHTINIWSQCLEKVTNIMIKDIFNNVIKYKPSFYMLIGSGARGSVIQMRQICTLRGLMIKPSGKIVETPIISNFKEGLTVIEYFLSTHGSRKGVIDTSIRTAAAGYLTRRLINATQNEIIRSVDCNTVRGIFIKSLLNGSSKIIDISNRLYGRVLASDLINSNSNELLLCKNTLLGPNEIQSIINNKIEHVHVRSILTCDDPIGICQKCYGVDLNTQKYPMLGESVGVIAAQSIGEPGTQLTMRTFHLGGILSNNNQVNEIYSHQKCKILFKNVIFITNKEGINYVIGHHGILLLINNNYSLVGKYNLPYGTKLHVVDGDIVDTHHIIASWDPYTVPIISLTSGTLQLQTNHNASNGNTQDVEEFEKELVILDDKHKTKSLFNGLPAKIVCDKEDQIYIQNFQKVFFGDILGISSRTFNVNQDITGDISKISQLFEASKTNTPAIISPINGYAQIFNYQNNTSKVIIKSTFSEKEDISYNISNTKSLQIKHNQYIHQGELLTNGNIPYEEALSIFGLYGFIDYFLSEVQSIYINQGVAISDKHLELVLSKMIETKQLSNVYKQLDFDINQKITSNFLYKKNIEYLSQGKKIAIVNSLLDGITYVTLKNNSFISAASFQNTSKILTEAAMFNKIDLLLGPQENIIIGRLIPIGTGFKKIDVNS